ncbi:von Willebrand factor C domain-containing protein 2-like isoform X4 [Haliotis rubra]|uniref:von Willebrand factor C domain-containing protein 2-like isoform X4 n=1 Tax=Haliotis rubra TaxID=36100 RepID=UPI001EE563C5|nr:von Willebrand factor C domain-containing protein 2-like isoform X4 [Haliotis rubra]
MLFFLSICFLPLLTSEAASIATNNDLCVIGNKTYHAGETISNNPCRPCRCGGGNAISCMIVDCAMVMCVDPTRKDGQCCQYCPNGRNCKYNDHVIKEGEVYKPDANTECKCNTQLFGPDALKALCVKSA